MNNNEDIILKVDNLKKYFPIKKGVFRKTTGYVKAIDDVSFFIKNGETLGLVGESGCGKTTTGRCVIQILKPTEGNVLFNANGDYINIVELKKESFRKVQHEIQMVFQDPFSSLDPRMTVRDIISEPLRINKIGKKQEHIRRVDELLEKVGLNPNMMNRYPHEFSGGQRQRIGVARALIMHPRLIICDEPVSALDVSVQAQIINLLSDLQQEMKLTYLFIAHDLSVVEHISDRVMVMYLGKIVEIAAADELYKKPKHPYLEALISAVPLADADSMISRVPVKGGVPDPSNPPSGCNFHPRCSYAQTVCSKEEPPLDRIAEERYAACHYAKDLDLKGFFERRSQS